jgi:hypothetical protein
LTSQFSLGLGLSVAALAAGVSLYWLNGSDGKKSSRHGPGPKGVPILGNAGDLPTGDQPWVDYMQWAKKYGAVWPIIDSFNPNAVCRGLYLHDGPGTTDILDQ